MIYEDDQLKPDIGRQVVGKLLERDRVDLVTGMPWSNVLLATAKPILEKRRNPHRCQRWSVATRRKAVPPNYFSLAFQNDTPHEAMGRYAQMKGRSVCI